MSMSEHTEIDLPTTSRLASNGLMDPYSALREHGPSASGDTKVHCSGIETCRKEQILPNQA